MAAKKTTRVGASEKPKLHYCREHGLEAKPFALGFKRKIRYRCEQGCNLHRKQTEVR